MKSINSMSERDEIIASIDINGHQKASLCRSDFSSVDEVMRQILSMAGNFVGLARLYIRNKTQGWNMVVGVVNQQNNPSLKLSTTMSNAVVADYGRQLSIPWH